MIAKVLLVALLALAGCHVVHENRTVNRCRPKVLVVYAPLSTRATPQESLDCPEGTHVRMERAGDGEKLRSVVVCDCPHESAVTTPNDMTRPDAGARWR